MTDWPAWWPMTKWWSDSIERKWSQYSEAKPVENQTESIDIQSKWWNIIDGNNWDYY